MGDVEEGDADPFLQRRSLKVELKALQERVGITFLYVTHDQEEALTMSDRLAVMHAGRSSARHAPHDYEEPADTDVAGTSWGVEPDGGSDVVEPRPPAPSAASGWARRRWRWSAARWTRWGPRDA